MLQNSHQHLNSVAGPSGLAGALVMLVVRPEFDIKLAIGLKKTQHAQLLTQQKLPIHVLVTDEDFLNFYLTIATVYSQTVARSRCAVGRILWIPSLKILRAVSYSHVFTVKTISEERWTCTGQDWDLPHTGLHQQHTNRNLSWRF